MMILGTALWLFPRSVRREPIGPYHNLVVFGYALLTVGTLARAVTEFFDVQLGSQVWAYVRLGASTAQVAGILIGIFALWGRVRGAAVPRLPPPGATE